MILRLRRVEDLPSGLLNSEAPVEVFSVHEEVLVEEPRAAVDLSRIEDLAGGSRVSGMSIPRIDQRIAANHHARSAECIDLRELIDRQKRHVVASEDRALGKTRLRPEIR
jgi:hypothetical protein